MHTHTHTEIHSCVLRLRAGIEVLNELFELGLACTNELIHLRAVVVGLEGGHGADTSKLRHILQRKQTGFQTRRGVCE